MLEKSMCNMSQIKMLWLRRVDEATMFYVQFLNQFPTTDWKSQ